ncbi:glycoside hydrolase family 88/105 protein [Enterococcus nangangensis]|uniref:glycoside hydrolase family 88/105 protein n=1 Tax=Enterococcus nangangensis TaxID=2559926 RepID=UPI0010F8CD45|nr:glycoside hydrolase family 88 protein [Enterococcus nangangensis]
MEEIKVYFDQLIHRSTPERPVWNQEAILDNRPPHWSYIDGCMAMAALDMYEVTQEDKYFQFLDDFIDYYIAEDGTILGYEKETYNADSINEGKVLFALYAQTKKEKYRKAIELLYSQLLGQPRIKAGNFWHKLIYPHQVWLDGLYMIQPFYAAYELHFNDGKNIPDILQQFANVAALMKDEKTGLLYHGYDEAKTMFWADPATGLSPNFWTRSIGWYMMALVDTIELLQKDYAKVIQPLIQQLQDLTIHVLNFQEPQSKLFYQVTVAGNQEGNYLETSGSCAIAYTLMKGARLGVLPSADFERGADVLRGVMKEKLVVKDAEFVLKDICLVAGLGGGSGKGNYEKRDGSFAYYISEPRVNNDAKGIGPLVYAYSEFLRK